MARKSNGPWWNAQKQAYFVQHKGERINLGSDPDAAQAAWRRLTQTGPRNVAGALTGYIDSRARCGPRTLAVMRGYAAAVAECIGPIALDRLRPADLRLTIERPEWAPSTRGYVYRLLLAALKRVGVKLPADELDVPGVQSRGESAVISEQTHAAYLAVAPAYLRDVLAGLYYTGCRPSELCKVQAGDLDVLRSAWVLREHKTARKTGKPRIVYVPPDVMAKCTQLATVNPDGPLYRGRYGQRLSAKSLHKTLTDLRERHGLPRVLLYGYRHTFATRALTREVPAAKVAALLGHKGTAMLFAHYAHLLSDADTMTAALGRINDGGASPGP